MDLNITEEEERSKKKVRVMFKTSFDFLPYEIVWQILVRVPAQDIFRSTMFVCKSWYGMINTNDFRYAHLHRSTPGHLVKNLDRRGDAMLTMPQDTNVALSKSSYDFPGHFWSSCNGLILMSAFGEPNENKPLVITNPLTKQCFTLPPFFPLAVPRPPYFRSAIAYAATSMEYKVIATSYLGVKHPDVSARFCAVFTAGVDTSWRLVDTQHLSVTATLLFLYRPFATQGFVHWTEFGTTHMLTLNVETEKFAQVQIPRPKCYLPRGIRHYYFPVAKSSSVSVLIALTCFKWEVLEMEPETGKWTKMPGIDITARKNAINRCLYERDVSFKPDDPLLDWKPFPVGWLKYPEIIFFAFCQPDGYDTPAQSGFRGAYNVRTQRMKLFDLLEPHEHPYLVHSYSLVRI